MQPRGPIVDHQGVLARAPEEMFCKESMSYNRCTEIHFVLQSMYNSMISTSFGGKKGINHGGLPGRVVDAVQVIVVGPLS